MALLKILEFPDPQLRKQAVPVETIDDSIQSLVDDMLETMYDAKGVGLAATQVNVQKRIVVMDVSEDKAAPLCFINPEIYERDGFEESEEGCLSVPGIFENVARAETIKVRALDRNGEAIDMEADGLLAVCIQHELDHLKGKLFVDYLSTLKRQRIRKKMEKAHRQSKDSESAAQPVV